MQARDHPDLIINAVTPGFVETNLTKGYTEHYGKSGAELGMKKPDEATLSVERCLFEDVGSGLYFGSDGVRSPLHQYRSPGDPEYVGTFEAIF